VRNQLPTGGKVLKKLVRKGLYLLRTNSQHHTTLEHKIARRLIPVLTVNLVDKRMNGVPRIAQCPALPSQPRWTQGRSSAPTTAPTNSETRRDLLSVSATS